MFLSLALLAAALPETHVKLSAWMVFYDDGASVRTFEARASVLDTVSFDWIKCKTDGRASRAPAAPLALARKEIALAHLGHTKVLALTSNSGATDFDAGSVEAAMATPAAMKRHADELLKIVTEDGFDGVDLDYELLKAGDRSSFSRFVTVVANEFHRRHLEVAIAVHPKTSEPGGWDGAQAQDWAVLGRAVDAFRVMAYDQHWETSEPGPVASPDWVEQVATFAMTEVPKSKIDLGIPAYGYDWVQKAGVSIDWTAFSNLVAKHGQPTRDPSSQELTLQYGPHKVFFADGPAEKPKLDLAARLGLRGVAMWRLGSEDPSIWTVLAGRAG